VSIDKSLKLRNRLVRARSVLTRAEQIRELEESGRWHEGDSIYGLPKVRVRKLKRRVVKVPKKEADEAVAPEVAASEEAPASAKSKS